MSAIIFILNIVAYIWCMLLLFRWYSELSHVALPYKLCEFIGSLTNWCITPFRRIVGNKWAEWSALFCTVLCQLLLLIIQLGFNFAPVMIVLAIRNSIGMLLDLAIILIIMYALLSWIQPLHQMLPLLQRLTDLFLKPLARIVPKISGVDISPLIAILIAQGLKILIMESI